MKSVGRVVAMSRAARFVVVVAGLLLSSPAGALPRFSACRSTSPAHRPATLDGSMCLLVQDPWQDCDEDPWQLSAAVRPAETFSDPWQDDVDPWQPVFATSTSAIPVDVGIDPWQPVLSRLVPPPAAAPAPDATEDPWQPTVLDPWQDGEEDPWQLP